MAQNAITAVEFSEAALLQVVRDAGHRSIPPQVEYVGRYCRDLGARTLVVENHYIDRHYLDEFALYYCRNLVPPANSVVRVHFFKKAFSQDGLTDVMARALGCTTTADDDELLQSYIGFMSVRPVEGVPVGRTILPRLPDGPGRPREIEATYTHDVHLANLTLQVDGLPFQQQDLAVGACATASLWSAISRVARLDGMRAPTPAAVTQAVCGNIRLDGRSIPASRGPTLDQLCEAAYHCGLAAEALSTDHHVEYAVAALHAYLRSGIPVLLALVDPSDRCSDGHVVVAAGFQEGDEPDPDLHGLVNFRSARLQKLYVHDDRIGPYARAHLKAISFSDKSFYDKYGEGIRLEIDRHEWLVLSLLAPVYPKMRLSVKSLTEVAEMTADVLEEAVKRVGEASIHDLSVEFLYQRSGTFMKGLNGRISPKSAAVVQAISLSRWCGLVRWYVEDQPAFEFVCDTTDIARGDGRELVRAVLCLDNRHCPELQAYADRLEVPFAAA